MKKTVFLMVQGTMSSVGKSLTVAGLCRIFRQDGYRVAPFKSQNMALNSYVTDEGLEMGRAQVMQAEACGVKPSVCMNPILLKPTDDRGSQVIVNGEVVGNMEAADYFRYRTGLIPDILAAVEKLKKEADIIVIEGAGSPAEINLKKNDIVNMGMAGLVDAPVILVGDIDRGGVFAQLVGTVDLLEADERERIKGLVINKFRGDIELLKDGISMLEEKACKPVLGVIPYMDICLEDEDSLTEKFAIKKNGRIRIGVIRLPHISNFTDFDVFAQFKDISVMYITDPGDVDDCDMIILPGTKNTISDMEYLKVKGFDTAITGYADRGKPVWGICGGFQMLGCRITDPYGAEAGGESYGLGLLEADTVIRRNKYRKQTSGHFTAPSGIFSALSGIGFEGYEIHMGETIPRSMPLTESISSGTEEKHKGTAGKADDALREFTSGETGYCRENVFGTYIHGIFDREEVCRTVVGCLAKAKGFSADTGEILDFKAVKEAEYDRLADTLRRSLDMKAIYRIMGIEND